MRKHAEIDSAFSRTDELNERRSFFLVGIGGAGMSALARMLTHRGFSVRGSDSTVSSETERLSNEGIEVRIGHSGEPIGADDVVVLTDAIDLAVSPEVARARELRLVMVRRSQVLGWLLRDKKVIAVTGTHGKTTTTGMLGTGLQAAGLDPVIVVGAAVPQFGGPVVEGKGDWAVVEACEAYDSFHDLDPTMVLLTNLELDHVDFHGSYENLLNSVVRFVDRAGPTGCLVYCQEDKGAREVAASVHVPTVGYTRDDFERVFMKQGDSLLPDRKAAGLHNLMNAAGAAVAAEQAGVETASAAVGIAQFEGAERRLQVLYRAGVTVVDDYAHHPTEIVASIQALRERFFDNPTPESASGRLIVVYQPHLYSRTEPLIDEFARALSGADEVVITDIYPAREDPIPGVSSARIAEQITVPVHYVPSRYLLPMEVAKLARSGDVVVGMGAGNISEFGPAFVKEWSREARTTLRIAVAFGGDSAEREVAILSGRAVHASLRRLGYDSQLIDISETLLGRADLSFLVGPERPDLVFLAVHGTRAEDGAIQGLLEMLHVPYTGSGIQASAIAMDKAMTKQILDANGIRTPRGVLLKKGESGQSIAVTGACIVKPNAQGSTVGLTFVEGDQERARAIERAFEYDDAVLIEEWVRGMEISVPVLGDRPLPPVEIAPAGGKYDFRSKYTPGATEEIVPARLSEAVLAKAQAIALKVHQTLDCKGATRTDMIVSDPSGEAEIYVLEVNTVPGMTDTSLLPNSARAAGLTFDDLVKWQVAEALERHGAKT